MTRKEQIRSAYKLTGDNAGFYDGMMTYSTFPGKAICRLVWNMNGEKNLRYVEQALSGVPEDFAGKLLEVPVGTGILTMPIYKALPDADITCLDYSADMMGAAQKKAESAGLKNITFRQGDVGALPFQDDTFDIVLSMNGFHAFPDKEAAIIAKKDSEHQKRSMSRLFRGKAIFRPLNTGWIDEHMSLSLDHDSHIETLCLLTHKG